MTSSIKPEYEIGYECACPECQRNRRTGYCKYEQVIRMVNEKESPAEYLFVCQNPICKSVYKAGNDIPLVTMK